MPVVVDPDSATLSELLTALPPGGHGMDSTERLSSWLDNRPDEYVAVLGPGVDFAIALEVCETLRFTRPTVSVVIVRDKVDTDVLTKAMHAGVRDVVPTADLAAVSGAVERAYQLWIALRGPGGVARQGRIVACFSPKGGVGKTTAAVNLALALADRGARQVCLVDLDLAFGDVAITLQLFPSHSIEHAVGSEDSLDFHLLEPILTRHEDSLMVLAAPSTPDARDRISPTLIARTLRTLAENFDFVVVDTAPAFDELTLTALDEVDECVMVATLDVPTLKNVKVALETMDALGIAQGHRHLLLNRADDEVGIGAEKVEAILGLKIAAQVATAVEIAAATNAGRPIVAARPDHASSLQFQHLAARLAGVAVSGERPSPARTTTPEESREERGGFFRRRR
ncbi:AAA family ATPase [Nocardioides zeae]|uniref:AAA family ATPase n=1 Tax=Nocardioides imazamoxiresistens TaxID=3231893 RepID=A0ABU3PY98_9ACTN|nr:AAA family ATPase [Nocardioides zeae]MDT9593787.1 AAA family ATPase [Nocardioides zeae]